MDEAAEARVVRGIRLGIGGGLCTWAVLFPPADVGRALCVLVVVTGLVLRFGVPDRWRQQAHRATLLFGCLLIGATVLRGPLDWWAPVGVLMLLGPLAAVMGLVVSFVRSEISRDDGAMNALVIHLMARTWVRQASAVGGLLVSWWVSGDLGATLLVTPAALATVTGWPSIASIGLASMGLALAFPLVGSSLPWRTVAVVTAVVALSRIPARPPLRTLDLPSLVGRARHPWAAFRLWRTDRALGRGEWERAAGMAGDLISSRPLADDARFRGAAACVQLGRPQDVMDYLGPLIADPRPNVQAVALRLYAQALTLSDRPQEALPYLDDAARQERTDDMHQARVALAVAEALVAIGKEEQAVEHAAKAADVLRGRTRLVERMQAMRITAHARLQLGDLDGARRALNDSISLLRVRWLRQYVAPERERDQEALVFSRGAALLIEQARMNVLEALIDLDPRSGESEASRRVVAHDLKECSELLALLNSPMDRSEVDLLRANHLSRSERSTDRRKALNLVVSALADLDRVRHSLRSQSARAQWSERFNAALREGLALAHLCGDSERTAELIELARVQAIPVLGGKPQSEDDVELMSAPTVRVRGAARVIRSGDDAAGPVDIEAAAASAAGEGAWWLSYWGTEHRLYWSLVPPDKRPMHGVIECGPGSALNKVLDSLYEALPVTHEGEDRFDFAYRLNESPLLVSPSDEATLAHRLGALILPFPLRSELTKRWEAGDGPLPLAISPAPELGQVPWASLAVDGPEGPRLIEVATWSLAPSATLLAVSGARRPNGLYPVSLAVLDPTDHATWEELPAARMISQALPSHVIVLGGRHWDAKPATPTAVTAALGHVDRCSTVVFGCHASRGVSDRPSSSALVLAGEAPNDEPALLTAANLLGSGIALDQFPMQVSLQACDTSDLASASSGEWLSLAPAFLAAGASTVLTTLFPLLDEEASSAPDGLLQGVLDGRDLAEAVREEQLRGLKAWRQRDDGPPASLADAPIVWGAYAPCCTGRADPGLIQQAPLPVSRRLAAVLVEACNVAKTLGDQTITSADVMTAYVTRETEVLESSFLRGFFGAAGVVVLPKLLRARSSQPKTPYRPSDELLGVIREAAGQARQTGSSLEPEHLVKAVFSRGRGPGYRFLQAMRLRRLVSFRQEVANNLREAELKQANTWQPTTSAAARGFVNDVIAAIPNAAPHLEVSRIR